jgi:Domain of unknown function (DUF4124)
MRKIVFTTFLVFGLFVITGNIFGQGYYKWVDEKGAIHFSENPPSSIGKQEKGPPKENGIEVLKASETKNQPQGMVSDGKNKRIFGFSQTGGST